MSTHALSTPLDEFHQCSRLQVRFTRAKVRVPKHVSISSDVLDSVLGIPRGSCALMYFSQPKRVTRPS
ncbi:hypothetical protein TIFTF001_034431 [Ficus carica]|uniref:Uncharacterized protein n=1 Tax=Ficus carica TaxID=3494 RepID=A0AA88E0G0_FICCA|nr:hypothetical protein TIFTF001_034431 [Ficus carica]